MPCSGRGGGEEALVAAGRGARGGSSEGRRRAWGAGRAQVHWRAGRRRAPKGACHAAQPPAHLVPRPPHNVVACKQGESKKRGFPHQPLRMKGLAGVCLRHMRQATRGPPLAPGIRSCSLRSPNSRPPADAIRATIITGQQPGRGVGGNWHGRQRCGLLAGRLCRQAGRRSPSMLSQRKGPPLGGVPVLTVPRQPSLILSLAG